MKSAYSIFKEIENTSGKNDKIAIIKANSDNSEFKKYLKFLYDDMIVTGLSSKKIGKEVDESFDTYFEDEIEVMNYLRNNNTGRDIDIANVQNFIDSYLSDDRWVKFLEEVFTKSYKCGITSSSVNKALGKDFIKEFKVQLAHPFEKYSNRLEKGVAYTATTKLDGHRTVVRVNSNDGLITFRTRKGHEIFGLDEIENEIRKNYMPEVGCCDMMLDGEITVVENECISDVFQETSKIIRKDGSKTGLRFNLFDIVPYNEFIRGQSEKNYEQRRGFIDNIFKGIEEKDREQKFFRNVDVLYSGNDAYMIERLLKEAINDGEEGIMININDSCYYTKRHSGLLKCKEFYTSDCEVVDVFSGTGKYQDVLGGVVVRYKGGEVSVGSGFTDEQRRYYWDNKDEILGKIIEVQYFSESSNQKDETVSLRFPTFKGLSFLNVRLDKDERDVNYE